MKWLAPDFEEINLSGEVTAYVNTDDEVRKSETAPPRREAVAEAEKPREAS
ncbi:MAG TPA: pyrroloquinoline quinone precursor peptide PqqA [Planctomycetaceae bacterium]|nr:pyrroloquinoline quinone precursor peptide PqqA [Planctomycetaceae bacterium]